MEIIQLQSTPTLPPPEIHPAAKEAACASIARARKIEDVSNIDALAKSADAQEQLRRLVKITEASRSELKRPILDAGRAIDAAAKEFSAPLEAEAMRLGRLSATFLEAERKREAERRREAEEAERKRLADLAAEQAAAEKAGDFSSETAAAAEERAIADVVEIRKAAAAESKTPKGATLRKTWKFEVEDIRALASAHPELVEIKPRTAAIRAVIKDHDLPGVRRWRESTMCMRTGRGRAEEVIDEYDY